MDTRSYVGNWDNLPLKIVKIILSNVPSKKGLTQCLVVKKSWFLYIQIFLYRKIQIDINSTDKLLQTILNSPYKYGIFTKEIEFTQPIQAPTTNSNYLQLLISSFPNVEAVDFVSDHIANNNWEYLLNVIKRGSWKLKFLPNTRTFRNSLGVYEELADMMNKSLLHLQVHKSNDEFDKYDFVWFYLENFIKLESIKVLFLLPEDITHVNNITVYSPLLHVSDLE